MARGSIKLVVDYIGTLSANLCSAPIGTPTGFNIEYSARFNERGPW